MHLVQTYMGALGGGGGFSSSGGAGGAGTSQGSVSSSFLSCRSFSCATNLCAGVWLVMACIAMASIHMSI